MSRAEFTETITIPLGPGGSLIPVPGVGLTPYSINPDGTEGQQAPAYAGRTGPTPAESLITDTNGQVSYWLDGGDYNVHVEDQKTPPRIQPYVRGFSSIVFDIASLLASAQNVIQATGDCKFSLQAQDHGINPDTNAYEWLLIESDIDGGGRKVSYAIYPGLYNLLYPGIDPVAGVGLDANGNYRLPNLSGRSLVVAGAASGLTARTLLQLFGTETHSHTAELAVAALAIDPIGCSVSVPSAGISVNDHAHGSSQMFSELAIGTEVGSNDTAIWANLRGQFGSQEYWYDDRAWGFFSFSQPPVNHSGIAISGSTDGSGAVGGSTSPVNANGATAAASTHPGSTSGSTDSGDSNSPSAGMNLFVKT